MNLPKGNPDRSAAPYHMGLRPEDAPRARIINAATGGQLLDREQAEIKARLFVPPSPVGFPETFVLNLGADQFEIVALRNLLLPFAERIRSGFYGSVRLIVSTTDVGVELFIDYLANKHFVPFFISNGVTSEAIRNARPAGDVSATEMATLEAIVAHSSGITAAQLAEQFGIAVTAAGNRLVNLEKRGLIYRLRQAGREGDRFVDPRVSRLGATLAPEGT